MELRLVGVSEDGRDLVLATDDGTQHQLAIDDRLRAAVNGHLSRLGQLTMALESRISPREIQTRVRAGESAEHVALTAGVPLERVLRFVGPVLREREHVVEQAARARVLVAGGGPSSLLGDVVTRVAQRRGLDLEAVTWDAARRDDHSWAITITWPDGAAACWQLDLVRHQVTPADAAARRFSGVAEPAPEPLDADPDDADPQDADQHAGPAENVRPLLRRVSEPETTAQPAAPSDVPLEFDDDEPADDELELPAADVADDADGTDERDDDTPDNSAADDEPTDADRPAPPRGPRRVSVPKWDDIVFGMKPRE